VLILDQSSPGVVAFSEISGALRAEFMGQPGAGITFYEERLDLNRFSGPEHLARVKAFVNDKYRDIPLGAFVAMGPGALEFAETLRAGDWAGLPIVFVAVPDAPDTRSELPPRAIGRTLQVSFANAVRAANMIVPRLKRLAIVGDPLDRQTYRRHFKMDPAFLRPDIELIDLTGLAMPELSRRVGALAAGDVVYFTSLSVDGDGTVFTPRQALQQIARAANRPVIVDVETYVGYGAVGGFVVQPARMGHEAAQLVRRVLDGEDVWTAPSLRSDAVRPIFDWRELQKWNVSAESLPAGSDIRFRSPSDWERNRWRILLFVAGLLLQSFLITWLIYADRRRRAAEANAAMLHAELAHSNRVTTAGALTASIAHEIRQPLTAIVSSASAGLNFLRQKTPDLVEVRDALQQIVNEGHRADSVIVNLRAMFRKDVSRRVPCDVNALIRQVLALADRQVQVAGVTVLSRLAETPPSIVTGDPVQLQQVFLNLMMNAMEAMGDTPRDRRFLEVTTRPERDKIWISFEDWGPGIDDETLGHIFDPFFTTKPGGMGMGLSICKSIIEAHDGRLTATRRPGGGAAFLICLPLQGTRP
jgi:signal transduction histidine kinase